MNAVRDAIERIGGVGVRSCDHALDLRIRSGRRRRASPSYGMPGKRASAIPCWPKRRNALTACAAVPHRTRARPTQISSPPVGGRGLHSGLQARRFTQT
jgi:hypothetical protein